MPRKQKEIRTQRPLTLRDLAKLPAKKSHKKKSTSDLLKESILRNYELQRLNFEWFERGLDSGMPGGKNELLLQKYLAMEKYIYSAESVDIGYDKDCKSVRFGHMSYDVSDPTKATITVNLFAPKEEINLGLKYAIERLLFERTILHAKSREDFYAEIRITKGKDADKILSSLRDLLGWYDKYKDLPVAAIVVDMYGEEATRDDREFNRKKQTVYEKQRQAETCIRSAQLGIFPPHNLTRARSKRPRK
jgi:hypothetical protein